MQSLAQIVDIYHQNTRTLRFASGIVYILCSSYARCEKARIEGESCTTHWQKYPKREQDTDGTSYCLRFRLHSGRFVPGCGRVR